MVRFLLLFPSDPLEVSFAVQLLERLKRTYSDIWIGILVPEQNGWISKSPIIVDELFFFKKNPGEYLNQIRDLLPDHLIDLSCEPRFKLFIKRTQLMHFSLTTKFANANREIQDSDERYAAYSLELDKLLSVFDLAKNDKDVWKTVMDLQDK